MQCEHEKILIHDLQTYTRRIPLLNVNLSLFSYLCECIYCMINATTLFVSYLFQIYMHISNIHIYKYAHKLVFSNILGTTWITKHLEASRKLEKLTEKPKKVS